MTECYNFGCVFRRWNGRATNTHYCDHVACPNKTSDIITVNSTRTMTDEEVENALRNSKHQD